MAGNANSGSKTDKLIREALMLAAKRVHSGDPQGRIKLAVMAEKVVEAACEGDLSSFKEIADRIDGKSTEHRESEVNVTFHDARKRFEDKIARLIERRATQDSDAIVH